MSNSPVYSLQDYKIQRKYRQQKRKKYLHQFEQLRQKFGVQSTNPISNAGSSDRHQTAQTNEIKHPQQSIAHVQHAQGTQPSRSSSQEEELLSQENALLKQKLAQIDQEERLKLQKFKGQMQKARSNYMSKLQLLKETQMAEKSQIQAKTKKMEEQIINATKKNHQIAEFNKNVEEELQAASSVIQKYQTEIKTEYDKKLSDFDAIFTASSEKISALQDQYDEEQFVDQTLQNQELIESIKQNSEKAQGQIQKIVEDYSELLQGKSQIFTQLAENNKMKEDEIAKMSSLEEKLKTVCEKLNEEKKIYLSQNKKMTEELLEIKDLLGKVMNSGPQ